MADEKKLLSELEQMYQDSIAADKDVVAEMRSNILLIAGDHYNNKRFKNALDSIRGGKEANQEEQRIRLTKNHVKKIHKIYVNKIVAAAPGVMMAAANENELQDQKSAELHNAVWKYVKEKKNLVEDNIGWASDFIGFGEVFVLIGWDWTKGYQKGKQPELNEMGEQTGESIQWSGEITYDRIFAPDMFRPAQAKSWREAQWWGCQVMVPKKELESIYPDEKYKKAIEPSSKTTFNVFDYNKASYEQKKDMVLVKKIFYKPSAEYPEGYFYYFTDGGLLSEGVLPGGIWPFAMAGFDEVPTHPRYRSIIRDIKPYQLELNRTASKIAEHQITLGDDKIVIANGAKMSPAGSSPGIRAYSVSGPPPTILPGRTGEQYLNYMNAQIAEMYNVASIPEELEEKQPAQVDPYALLLQSSRWKSRFSLHIQKYQNFYKELVRISLEYLRYYANEEDIAYMVGKNERVNISEFKNKEALCYQIRIEEQSDDIETRLGKKLSIDRFIQYSGNNLNREDLGKFIRLDPYMNKEQLLKDFTMDYDSATNLILAIDRGEQPQINQYDNTDYMLQKLVNRQRQADFKYLHPHIQNLYGLYIQQYEQIKMQQIQQVQAMKDGFIPAQSMLVTVDAYRPDPKDPLKQVRIRVPYDSIMWLLERLEAQGATQEQLQMQQQGTIADMVSQMRQNQPQGTMPTNIPQNPMAIG
jgi:hypothetical protein